MKFCSKCGKEILDEAVVCPACGCAVESAVSSTESKGSTLKTIAYVFMVIACVVYAWTLVPLIWLIPMTLKVNRARKENLPLSLAFKVCTLLFANFIAGILLLCDKD